MLKWFSKLVGVCVGVDEFGNRYYETRPKFGWLLNRGLHSHKHRRWVVFVGHPEPSKVPANWHGWLHYTVSEPPATNAPLYPWQRPHAPNLTGTPFAYKPPGSTLETAPKKHQDYQSWQPKNEEEK
jgi:NADH:ubiquinone oxidoreductase subunit